MNQAIRLYFGAGRGGGRVRVGRGGGRGGWVVGTCWLFNGHGSTELTWAMTAYIGPPTAGQLWQLWQLTWAQTAYIGRDLTAVTAFRVRGLEAILI